MVGKSWCVAGVRGMRRRDEVGGLPQPISCSSPSQLSRTADRSRVILVSSLFHLPPFPWGGTPLISPAHVLTSFPFSRCMYLRTRPVLSKMNRNNYAPHGSSHGQYVHPQHRQDERNNNHALQASHPAPYSNGHGGRQEQHYDERGYGAPVQQRGDWNGVRGGSYQQEWAPSPSHGSSGYGEGGYEGGLREGSR
jgi:hypothetical protein